MSLFDPHTRRPDSTRSIASVLRSAALRATRAPSVHNTQPWRFDLHGGGLDVHADPARQLRVMDPARRQLTISCGSAVFNARVGVAAAGLDPVVHRFPDATQSNLVARIGATSRRTLLVDPIAAYDSVVDLRETNRRRFDDADVPAEVLDCLESAAALEGVKLVVVGTEEHRLALTRLARQADQIQLLNPAYRAELRAWSATPSRRDDVPTLTVPHVDGTAEDEIPMRDHDTHGRGWLPVETDSSRHQCLLLVCTDQDTMPSWLRAGEALERVLLELTKRGYVASPLTQVVEVPSTRAALRRELGLIGYPQVILRAGRAPLTPASRRRRLVDVLVERP